MEKSKNVNPNWMNDTYLKVISVSSKMFKWNIVHFFEKLNEFLDEFDKIEGFMANENFFKKVKEQPQVWNKLFEEILEQRLFGPKKYLPVYFDGLMLASNTRVQKPMAEKYFFPLWYMMTVNPTKIPTDKGIHILHIKSYTSYLVSFKMDKEIIFVVLRRFANIWHCDAYRDDPSTTLEAFDVLHFIEKT